MVRMRPMALDHRPSSQTQRQDTGQMDGTLHPLRVESSRYEPMRKITHPGEKIV